MQMQIRIDHEADAAYVRLSDRPVARTQPKNDQVIVDYDASGEVRGVEVLDITYGVDLREVLPLELADRLNGFLAEHQIRTPAAH